MEPAAKVDIKSEVYWAPVFHVSSDSKGLWPRYKDFPRGEVFKYFGTIYPLVGFVAS